MELSDRIAFQKISVFWIALVVKAGGHELEQASAERGLASLHLLCVSLNNRLVPNCAVPPCNLSPGGLQISDFWPLLRSWDYEIRDQRP